MKEIILRNVGDIYNLVRDCEELQLEVDEKQKEYENCGYDPCGYMKELVLDAEEIRDEFFFRPVKFQ